MMTPQKTNSQPARLSSREAVDLIPDGATIAVSGFNTMGAANSLHRALAERFQETASPRNLIYIHAAGFAPGTSLDVLAPLGMVTKVIGGHWGHQPAMRQQIAEEKVEAHNWPQGIVIGALRAAAGGEKGGLRSRIGLGTFIDPRQQGGCANETARNAGSMIRMVDQDGEEMLSYAPLEPDVALIRGWSADRLGNVSLGMEPLNLSNDIIAMAARNHNGKVLCQVRFIEDDVIYPSYQVAIPGFMIDALVVSQYPEKEHRQCNSFDINPALVNEQSQSQSDSAIGNSSPQLPDGPRSWIGRRAAMEVQDGDVFNLGIGIPGDTVGVALQEAGRLGDVISTIESGMFGGVALGGLDFGCALNPCSRTDQLTMFDMYHGGGLDVTVMGAAQIDESGNINVSQFNNRAVGCGGFIDITQSAKRVVFCSTVTVGGLEANFKNGQIQIHQEGCHRKFVQRVEQITFNGKLALHSQQKVLLVTERCVLELTEDGWMIIEVAPGTSIEKDVLPQMDFIPGVSQSCRVMPLNCFIER